MRQIVAGILRVMVPSLVLASSVLAFFIRDDETEPVQSTQSLSSKSGMLCPFAPVVTD
jgi:hypothetical protein